jgi:hypothetical protein
MYQKEIVLKVLRRRNKWTPYYYLVREETHWGWLGSSGDRRARELRAEGLVESKDFKEHGKSITYFRIKKH